MRRDFYRYRTTAANNAQRWAKNNRLGPAGGLLAEIIRRSHPAEPWAWVQTKSMSDWADRFGVSLRSLHRHLTMLHEAGVMTSEVRSVASLKKPGEYPIYRVTFACVVDILMLDDKLAQEVFSGESAKLAFSECQNGTLATLLLQPETPEISGFLEGISFPTSTIDSKGESSTSREVRRLRPRRPRSVILSATVEEDELKRPTNGVDLGAPESQPDDHVQKPKKTHAPAFRLGLLFESEWAKTRAAVNKLSLPFQPWAGSQKSVFHAWLNKDLIPRCGSEEEAAEAIVAYCSMVASGEVSQPGERMPVFRYMAKDFEKLRRAQEAAAPVDETADAFRAQQEAYRARRAAEEAVPVDVYIPEQFRAAQ